MTDAQKEKARLDMERSVDRMRDKLVEVCTIAADALKEMRELEGGDKWLKLSCALGTLRSKLRPEPGTLAWEIEIDWFVDHEPRLRLTPIGRTDFNFIDDPQTDESAASQSETGGGAHFAPKKDDAPARHMSNPEAAFILMSMAFARRNSVDDVTALQMGVNRLMTRHFQKQRNWARRRAAKAAMESQEQEKEV